MSKLRRIKIDKLEKDKCNVRIDADIDSDLMESIKKQGLQNPLVVRQIKRGEYGVVEGSRRLRALKELGRKTAKCFVHKDMDDVEAMGLSLQENLQRKNLDKLETAEAIASMWELMNGDRTYKEKMKEFEKIFGLKRDQVTRYLKISRLADKLKKKFVSTRPGRVDTHTLADVSDEETWDDDDKEEVLEEVSKEKGQKRRRILREARAISRSSGGEVSGKDAVKQAKQQLDPIYPKVRITPKYVEPLNKACKKENQSKSEYIEESVINRLEDEGYL